MNEKWDLRESNPVLLHNCSIAYDIFDAAVHRTPGPFPSSYSQSQHIPCQIKEKGKKRICENWKSDLGESNPILLRNLVMATEHWRQLCTVHQVPLLPPIRC
jgi:hypothetical protein